LSFIENPHSADRQQHNGPWDHARTAFQQDVGKLVQDYRSENDGRERCSPPGTGDCTRSLLVYADEKQDEQERKMQANFDAQDLARGNGPASHLPSVILYICRRFVWWKTGMA